VPLQLAELAVRFGCELRGDPDATVERVASLQEGGPGALAFLANPRYRRHLTATRATAVVLDPAAAEACPVAALVSANPYATYARIAQLLHPEPPLAAGRHPSAIVEPGAEVDDTAYVGALAYIAAGAVIGARVLVGPGSVVLADTRIGADTRLVARVTVCERVRVGVRCLLHPGSVLGADGFGHARDFDGYVRVPQVGSVTVGDDVEVGANTTIDRGAIGDTVIGDGVKIDPQVQVGHNVRIGEHTVIAACSGVSGSAVIGRRCMLGGMVGVVGHLEICDDVAVTGRTMVSSSIRRPGVYSSGLPADEARRFRRNAARFQHLDELARRVRRLEGASGTQGDDRSQGEDDE
jgi:UDP-3-O-[3-hydroxymyristoyl] glucosamine N-acyltransferase